MQKILLMLLNLFQALILVVGGCTGPCSKSEAGMKSAEIYNPGLNKWSRVSDLPVPLHSARMELLAQTPTLIGGYNGSHDSDVIYQYHVAEDKWIEYPMKLKEGRSSLAVFQVPQSLFPKCNHKDIENEE